MDGEEAAREAGREEEREAGREAEEEKESKVDALDSFDGAIESKSKDSDIRRLFDMFSIDDGNERIIGAEMR
jgi:hypothetical protein